MSELLAVCDNTLQNSVARLEGYIYLTDEVTAFLSVTKNICVEIKAQTSRLNEAIGSTVHTRGQNLLENGAARHQIIQKTTSEGELLRQESIVASNSEALLRVPTFGMSSKPEPGLQRPESAFNGASHRRQENFEEVFERVARESSEQNSLDKKIVERRLEELKRTFEQKLENLARKADSGDLRLESLESQLSLAVRKIRSAASAKDLIRELKASREDLDAAIKE